jgi:hypothetical protein
MMSKVWRNRKWLKDAASELGCGLLTMLLVTIPLWVITLATRGPGFAMMVLAGLVLVMFALALGTKMFRK